MENKNDKKLYDALLEIYRRAYKESDPPGDFDEMIRTGEVHEEDFFMNYSLPIDRLTEIFNEVCKEKKIRGFDKKRMHIQVYLGCSPSNKIKCLIN